MKLYAGVGARKTPPNILEAMTLAASNLETMGWKLRTGGAVGADWAFSSGVKSKEAAEHHLPWTGYNQSCESSKTCIVPFMTEQLIEITARHHPVWNRLTPGVQNLMTRNTTIVLGVNLDEPVKMVICWTPGGKVTGGTGHTMRMARTYGIPVFNLAIASDWDALEQFVEEQI